MTMRKWQGWAVVSLASVLIVTACAPQANNGTRTQSMQAQTTRPLHDAAVIPSYDGQKTVTTNQHGSTYSGMGSSVLSRIGSSGLHTGGISAKLESVLGSAGIDGMKVFVIDDTVILGETGRAGIRATHYDDLQSKVLSNTAGNSGTGRKHASSSSMSGTMGARHNPMNDVQKAKREIEHVTGGNVRVLVVTHAEGLKAIDRLRANMQKTGVPVQKVADDVRTVLKYAK